MVLPQVADQVAHGADLVRVEADGRLVEDEERRVVHHGVGQADALAEPLRERADDLAAHVLEVAEPLHVVDAVAHGARGDALEPGAEAEELVDPHVGVERDVLRHVADVAADVERIGHDVEARDVDAPVGGGQVAGEDLHRGALPGAVRPEEAHDLPLGHLERDVLNRLESCVRLGEIGDLDHS